MFAVKKMKLKIVPRITAESHRSRNRFLKSLYTLCSRLATMKGLSRSAIIG